MCAREIKFYYIVAASRELFSAKSKFSRWAKQTRQHQPSDLLPFYLASLLSLRGRVFTHSLTKVSARVPRNATWDGAADGAALGGKNPEQLRRENTTRFMIGKHQTVCRFFLWTLIVFRKRKIYNISTKKRRPISNICKRAPYVYKNSGPSCFARSQHTHHRWVKQHFLGSAHSAAHTLLFFHILISL